MTTLVCPDHQVPGDWYNGVIPSNVVLDEGAAVETSHSFRLCRSELSVGVHLGAGAAARGDTMFDVGPRGQVLVGEMVLLAGAWIRCEARVEIGPHTVVSWDVLLLDTLRLSPDLELRRDVQARLAVQPDRYQAILRPARPIRIGAGVWIGCGATILPGLTIGAGAIIRAGATVTQDVPPHTLFAGSPARRVRALHAQEAAAPGG